MREKKIGTVLGVFIPNVTMMFGVILFMRLGLIVSHAGLYSTLAIIGLGLLTMLITSASIASVATSMDVGSGGIYYLVTRTLGVEIGGALGIALFVSQLLNIALTITAFAYIFIEVFPQFNLVVVEAVALLVLALFSSYSARLALKLQCLILVILLISVGAIFFGSTAGMESSLPALPYYPEGKLKFWHAFALFYPALTGIEAGMALSGKLKNPSRSLMLGNATSLIFVSIVYAAVAVFAYLNVPYDALVSDSFALKDYANPSWLVTTGIVFATLSSALGCLLAAPRMLQSMAKDGIASELFAKEYGKEKEPRWALFFTVSVALAIMFFTGIDQIIPILAVICLISYGLLNFIAALGALMNAPSWRPKFKINYRVSLLGTFLCGLLMFMINPKWGCAGIVLILFFYVVMRRRDIEVSFQDFRSSLLFFFSRLALYRLSRAPEHAYTWHPKVLFLSNAIQQNFSALMLCNSLTRQSGILACASIIPSQWGSPDKINSTQQALEIFFDENNISCLTKVQAADSTYEGFEHLIQAYGMGPIEPNTVVIPVEVEDLHDPQLSRIVNGCQLSEKNLLLVSDPEVNSSSMYEGKGRKAIDIWWDSDAKDSFDLLVSIATTLHDSEEWLQSKVNLRAVVSTKEAKNSLKEYLDEFVSKSRLKIKVFVHTEPDIETLQADAQYIRKYSAKADLIILPFKQQSDDETDKRYRAHIAEMLKEAKKCAMTLIVCSYDNIEHREIYTYPNSR